MPDLNSDGTPVEEKTGDAGAGSGEDQGTQDQGTNQGGDAASGDQGDGGEEDDIEVPTRGSNFVKDRIIERKQKQIEKLRERGTEDGDGSDVATLVQREVNKILRPTLETLGQHQDEQELSSFLAKPENAHFKTYEKAARKYMATYKNVPIEFIFRGLDYANAMKRGAEASAKAKDEATRNQFGGSNARRQEGAPIDAFDMSEAEFMAEHNRRMNR